MRSPVSPEDSIAEYHCKACLMAAIYAQGDKTYRSVRVNLVVCNTEFLNYHWLTDALLDRSVVAASQHVSTRLGHNINLTYVIHLVPQPVGSADCPHGIGYAWQVNVEDLFK